MVDKSLRRVPGPRFGIALGVGALTLVRLAVATSAEDTPIEPAAKAPVPVEQRLVKWATEHHASLSLTVASLAGGRHVASHDGTVLRNPASVSKLLTAFAALKTLGPSYQYKTTVLGRVSDGHLSSLGLRGEGDPSLTSDHLQGIAARLSAMGVVAVDDAIIVDQSYFDDQFVPPAFEQQPDEWAAFRAPVCATAVDNNRLTLRVLPRAAGQLARVFVEPLGGAELSGEVRAVASGTKGKMIHVSVAPGVERPLVRVSGEIGANELPLAFERRTDDPRKVAGYALREALKVRGIKVPAEVSLGTGDGLPTLFAHESDALGILLHRLGKESDNFAAEMLLKSIGAKLTGVGSSAAGARGVTELLQRLGPEGEQLRLVNGSGLFDANRVSTNLLVRLIAEASADPTIAPEYLAQLSIGGVDGTLSRRLRKLPAGCLVRAKTGTLRTTISLAGLITRTDGHELAFAIVIENVKDQASTRSEIDRFIGELCLAPLA